MSARNNPVHGKRLLVVEDEFLILLDIQHILEAAGAQSVVTASRVDDALIALDNAAFDAAVLDLKIDKGTSAAIATRLKATGVPFVFLTGAPTETSLALEFGNVPIVGKPFDAATLLAALERVLGS